MKHLRWRILPFSTLVFVFAIKLAPGFAQNTKSTAAEANQPHQRYYTELGQASEKARNRANPLVSDPDTVKAGQKLFGQHCAECHGNTAGGGRKAPSLRVEEVRTATPGMLFWVLTNGVVRRGMPVWSKLPEQQRWQIVSYLKSLN